MLPPKTSHYAKFHRDRSNQLGDGGGVSIGPRTKNFFVTDRQKLTTCVAPRSVREARLTNALPTHLDPLQANTILLAQSAVIHIIQNLIQSNLGITISKR